MLPGQSVEGAVFIGRPDVAIVDGEGNVIGLDFSTLYDGPGDVHPLPPDFHDRHFRTWAWDVATRAWIENVEGERVRIWAEVKAEREALTAAGCAVPELGRVQTDPASLAAIEQRWGAAQADPEGWSAVWTMADNRHVPVDHGSMREIKLAVDVHVGAVRAAADAVRAALFADGVTTLAGLYAVPADLSAMLDPA